MLDMGENPEAPASREMSDLEVSATVAVIVCLVVWSQAGSLVQTNTGFPRLLENPGKSWIFISKASRTWKVLENEFGAGKSWKLNFEVTESPEIYLQFILTAGTEKLLPVQNTMCK